MRFSNWDAYFHMAAHGDKEAYQFLYKQFANKAKYIIRIALKEYTNLVVNPEDFCEFIDYLFLRIINEYDFNRGAFRKYCDYVMTVRIRNEILRRISEYSNQTFFFGVPDEEQMIEQLPDPNQVPIQREVTIDSMKAYISSPLRKKSKEDRIKTKILLLHYAGYKQVEMCKELKMTLGELRGYLKKIQEDEDIINFNLEMK